MRNNNLIFYDTVIAGGGPAGLSAALWCDELGLSALVIESSGEFGGQLLQTYNEVRNHLGVSAANGRELRDVFLSQLANRKFDAALSTVISSVDFDAKTVTMADGRKISYGALIVATGVRRRTLGIAGAESFQGRGIIESGKKNAETARGKHVVIIGGGDAALENALILGATAESVTLVHRRGEFRARPEFIAPVLANPRVSIFYGHVVESLKGAELLESVVISDLATGHLKTVAADLLLVRIGVAPNVEIFNGAAELDALGYVRVDRDCRTSIAGVFACGDVANPIGPTVSSAVGMGATAAKAVFAELKS